MLLDSEVQVLNQVVFSNADELEDELFNSENVKYAEISLYEEVDDAEEGEPIANLSIYLVPCTENSLLIADDFMSVFGNAIGSLLQTYPSIRKLYDDQSGYGFSGYMGYIENIWVNPKYEYRGLEKLLISKLSKILDYRHDITLFAIAYIPSISETTITDEGKFDIAWKTQEDDLTNKEYSKLQDICSILTEYGYAQLKDNDFWGKIDDTYTELI